MYFGLVAIPMRRLFAVTTALITLLAAGMASQAVNFLQQAGYFSGMADPLWDTSGFLSEGSILGRLLHSLIGYSDSPTGAQLIAYLADDRGHRRPDAPRGRPAHAGPRTARQDDARRLTT